MLALAGSLTSPAGARGADILYTTAASQGRIDGFRLDAGGQLAAAAAVRVATARDPRRILVVGCFLYVAEDDRVEVFRIKSGGELGRHARTVIDPDMTPFFLAASPDKGTLYVAEKPRDRVVAYPLTADGGPAASACSCRESTQCGPEGSCLGGRCVSGTPSCTLGSADTCAAGQTCVFDFTSCALGESGIRYQTLAVYDDLVYAAGAGIDTGVDAFPTEAGQLPERSPASCDPSGDRTPTRPSWCRRRINGPRLAVDEAGSLYIEDRYRGRILGFKQFSPPFLVDATDSSQPCPDGEANCVCSRKKKEQQKPDRKTAVVAPYEEIIVHASTLFGSDFQDGRVDGYNLRPAETKFIAKQPIQSEEDVRMSPVGLTAVDNMLYLATGEFDRVRAYRMRRRDSDGSLIGLEFVSETDEQEDSFPNDVAAAMPSACQ